MAAPDDDSVLDQVERVLSNVPDVVSPLLGRRIYEHLREVQPEHVLELGTCRGGSAAYIAAALEANGKGQLVTVDHSAASFVPRPEEVLSGMNLTDRVTFVRAHSSYTWYLKELVEARSDKDGNCEPLFDFCLLDGAHDWTVDGLAVILVEKLLREDGWLALDDLVWNGQREVLPGHVLSEAEQASHHVSDVFELIVKQHPSFTSFRVQDDGFGWAHKKNGAPRRLTLDVTQSPKDLLAISFFRLYRRVDRLVRTRMGTSGVVSFLSLALAAGDVWG